MKLLNKLNGWQRIYVLTCVLLAPMVATTVTIPVASDPNFIRSEFLPKLEYIPEADDGIDPSAKYLRNGPKGPGDANKQYRMPNGELIYEDKRYTQQEVEHAYVEAKLKSERDHRSDIIKVVSGVAIQYLLTIVSIYFLGWMIGWVYRGFRGR